MERSVVARGKITIPSGTTAAITVQLGNMSSVKQAYAVTVDNSLTDVALQCIIYNKEVLSDQIAPGSVAEEEVLAELATIVVDPSDLGTVLMNGLYIANGSVMIIHPEANPGSAGTLRYTIREAL